MKALSERHLAFVEAFMVSLNATEAAKTAGYSAKTAKQMGYKLIHNAEFAHVQAEIERRKAERAENAGITAEMVLRRWWEIATADPNDVVQYRRDCCRFCHGDGHAYQWIDRAEYERTIATLLAGAKDDAELMLPGDDGGYGFSPTNRPHADCPKCFGEGHGHVHANDTRDLSPGGRVLYAGAKETKEGFEVKLHDQAKALENVARHLGMFVTKVEAQVSYSHEDALKALEGPEGDES